MPWVVGNTVYVCTSTTTTSGWISCGGGGTPTAACYSQQVQVQTNIYSQQTPSLMRQQLLAQNQANQAMQQQIQQQAMNMGLRQQQLGGIQQPYTAPDQGHAALEEKKKTASERARGLLLSFLDRRERREFEKDKTISLRAASGTRYRIRWGRTANIEVMEGRRVSHRLCIHPADASLPVEDVMLAQFLHLKTGEVLRIANRHPVGIPGIPGMQAAA